MGRKFGIWALRLGLGTVIYVIATYAMMQHAVGWDRLGVFVAGFAFGLIAILSFCIAIAIGHFIGNSVLRLLLHPLVMVLLFFALSIAIVGLILGTSWDSLWRDLRPFVLLVAGIGVIEAVVGFLFERPAPPQAP